MINAIWSVVIVLFHFALAVVKSCLRRLSFARGGTEAVGPKHKLHARTRVAVIGGGIAGVSAAWSLKKSGKFHNVTLFEPRDVLGGNAKTYSWPVEGHDEEVRTGLSVLAWPKAYFRNYELLLAELQLPTTTVVPKFYVSADGQTPVFRQGEENERWQKEQKQWDAAVTFVRRVNKVCYQVTVCVSRIARAVLSIVPGCGANLVPDLAKYSVDAPSMYEITMLNPMTLIPARWFCRIFYGISDDFWNLVVVPIYSSSFLTARLDLLPCIILPVLDDIISVGDKDRLRELNTWQRSSKDVFDTMTSVLPAEDVMTGVKVLSVCKRSERTWSLLYKPKSELAKRRQETRIQTAAGASCLIHHKGLTAGYVTLPEGEDLSEDIFEESFDYVVFACPANAVDDLTNNQPNRDRGFRDNLFESIIPNVLYENERDENFVTGLVHSDRDLAIPCAEMQRDFFTKRFTNYIELHGDVSKGDLENSFVLGTWVPTAVAAAATASQPQLQSVDAPAKAEGVSKRGGWRRKKEHHSVSPPAAVTPREERRDVVPLQDGVYNMIVTYNAVGAKHEAIEKKARLEVDNEWAHPQFTLQSMALALAMPLLQGRHGAFYSASYTTPGNGHDLSLLSGLAVAAELTNGYYPFEETADAAAKRDFVLLQRLLFW